MKVELTMEDIFEIRLGLNYNDGEYVPAVLDKLEQAENEAYAKFLKEFSEGDMVYTKLGGKGEIVSIEDDKDVTIEWSFSGEENLVNWWEISKTRI